MKHIHYTDAQAQKLDLPGAKDVSLRVVIGHEDGAPNFTMMVLDVAPGGKTPDHSHPWEEEIFVRSGKGEIKVKDQKRSIRAGDVLYFAPEEGHQFLNTGPEQLEFICLIPHKI
jgi:quercetin dioxygenase-like cupin family protein